MVSRCPKCRAILKPGVQLCTQCGSKFPGLERLTPDEPTILPAAALKAVNVASAYAQRRAAPQMAIIFFSVILLVGLFALVRATKHLGEDTRTIFDLRSVLGKQYNANMPELDRFICYNWENIPDYDMIPALAGGRSYLFKVADGCTLDVSATAGGRIMRVMVRDTDGLGYDLDEAPRLFRRFGYPALPEPDTTARAAVRWDNVAGVKLSAQSNTDTDRVWQVSAEIPD